MGRRSLLVAAGWLGAAVVAVLVGLGAISVIGSGLTSSGNAPRTEAQVQRELAGASSPSAADPSSSDSLGEPPLSATTSPPAGTRSSQATAIATTKPPPTAVSRSFNTRGGTVVARCSPAGATITSMSPVSGFAVHEKTAGASAQAEGEFRSTSDNHDRVKFAVTCSAGAPVLSNRDSGSGSGDD